MNDGPNLKEREIISHLRRLGANVDTQGNELAVHLVHTEDRVRLAAQLARMTELSAQFYVGSPLLTGPELRHLKDHARLRKINIYGMPISGELLDVLVTLPRLEELHCTPKGRTKDALEHIGRCTNLRKLSLSGAGMPDDGFEGLAGLVNLEDLTLSDNPICSGLRAVRNMKRLRKLGLEETAIDDDALEVLAELPELESLFIASQNVTDRGMEHLAKCARLCTLCVNSPRITSRGLEKLAALKKLDDLIISETVASAAVFAAVAKLPNVRELACSAHNLSLETQIQVSALLPHCKIRWVVPDPRAEEQTSSASTEDAPKEKADQTTPFPKLLAGANDSDLCDATFIKIGDRYEHWIDASKYTPEERAVMLVWHSVGIIDNGGFEYLFSGSFDGDPDFHLTADAFKTVGLDQGYALFQQAFKLFPNGEVPTDEDQRAALYKAQLPGARSAINSRFWREAGGVSKAAEKNLAAYIRKNAAAFKHLK